MKIVRTMSAGLIVGAGILLLPAMASAHVVVRPAEVGVGAFQTFTTGVPNEKDVPVTALRLVVPAGVQSVTPTVKPGWEVTTKQSGNTVTEIDWSGGAIPAGMRDDFTFSAQAPGEETTLRWKAYQTYQDGTVVSWDQTPTTGSDDDEGGTTGPYSTTKVIDDLADASGATKNTNATGAYIISGAALALAVVAIFKKHRSDR